jgi:aminopeptidase YwaD
MKILFIFFSLLYVSVTAQEFKKTGVVHLNNLAADEMYGRGYLKGGYEKAVQYVESEFNKLGLNQLGSSYRQPFNYTVNTFPDSVSVTLDAKKLLPGKDFIVSPESGSASGIFKPVYFDLASFFKKEKISLAKNEIAVVEPYSNKIAKDSLIIIQTRIDELNAFSPVIELTKGKLTWSVAREASPRARIQIKQENFTAPINEIKLNISNELIPDFNSFNVIGMVKAKKKKCKDYLVVTAHLDHLGMMGSNAIFNGANDNASGVSMLLTLAEYYAKNPVKRKNIVFIAFGGEEAGLIGSKYFVENNLIDLKHIKFLMNIDLMGNGEEGITVVNATKFTTQFETLKALNAKNEYVKLVKPRGEAANSDHYWFTKQNVPSFFIYTMGGTTAYHDIFDRTEQLPMTEFDDLCKMIIDFFETQKK